MSTDKRQRNAVCKMQLRIVPHATKNCSSCKMQYKHAKLQGCNASKQYKHGPCNLVGGQAFDMFRQNQQSVYDRLTPFRKSLDYGAENCCPHVTSNVLAYALMLA